MTGRRSRLFSVAFALLIAATPVQATEPQSADAQIFADAASAYDHGDHALALHLWRLLADRGLSAAQANAGRMLLRGEGIAADPQAARKYLQDAANAGEAEGQRLLAEAFLRGLGGPADPVAGARWIAKAARGGDAEAVFHLGVLNDRGLGLPHDMAAARTLYARAAEMGHADAAFNYAVMAQAGEGGAKDVAEAARWYRRAAASGHGGAAHNLAVLYDSGRAGVRDLGQAARWYALAAEEGVALAADRLEELKMAGVEPASGPALADIAPAGAGPIVLPDPAGLTAARAPGIATPGTATPKAWTVRLASFSDTAAAERGRTKLAGDLGDLLDEEALAIRHAHVNGLGDVHRVVFGPLPSRAAANALCHAIKARGGDCLPGAPEG